MRFDELLKAHSSKEALAWLQSGKPDSRMLGELPTTAASIEIVRELYDLGAGRVTAMNIATYDTREENAGRLIVSLPREVSVRAKIFAWCNSQAREQGFDVEADFGQDYLFVMLD